MHTSDHATDDLLRAVADSQRRAILAHLARNGTTTIDELSSHLAGGRPSDDPAVELRHHHLPRLQAAGVVEFDDGTIELDRLPVVPLFHVVEEMLPDAGETDLHEWLVCPPCGSANARLFAYETNIILECDDCGHGAEFTMGEDVPVQQLHSDATPEND